MNAADTQDFFDIWDDRSRAYEKPLVDDETKMMAFKLLSGYTLGQISQALRQHIADPNVNQYIPRAPDLIRKILQSADNQFPGPEEAWAKFPRHESQSACICDEMSAAWGVACELDEISGRMAFKEAYSREVERSKQQGKNPRWFISTGSDKQQLEQVAMDAVSGAMMSPEAARVYLPHIPIDDLHGLADRRVTANQLLESHAQTVNSLDQLMLSAPEEEIASDESAKDHLAGIMGILKMRSGEEAA